MECIHINIITDIIPNCTKPLSRGFLRGRFRVGFVSLLMGVFVIAYFIYQKMKLAETLKTNHFKEFKLKQPLPQNRLAGKSYMRLKDGQFPMTMAALVKLEEEKNKQQPPRTNKEMRDVQAAEAYAKLKSSFERTNLPYSEIMTH